MLGRFLRLLIVIALTTWPICSAHAHRVALVIGNSTYEQGPLANPVNDAEAIGDALRDLGFEKVIRVKNATKAQMEKALSVLATQSAGADIAVVFFAGHGTERDGRNYLIPVDAKLDRASDLDLQALALSTVLDQIAVATKLKLVILDACRNNIFPLAGNRRSATRGLAPIEPEVNTLVAYAAKDGTTAMDSVGGKHSPFTEALLKHLPTPGLDVRFLLAEVRDDVVAKTQRQQVPHFYGSIGAAAVYMQPANQIRLDTPERVAEHNRLQQAKNRLEYERQKLALLQKGASDRFLPRHEHSGRSTAIVPPNMPVEPALLASIATDPNMKSSDPIRIAGYTLETTRKNGNQFSHAKVTPIGGGLATIEDRNVNTIHIMGTKTTQTSTYTYLETQFGATISMRTTGSTSQDGTLLSRSSSSRKVIFIRTRQGPIFPMKIGSRFGFDLTSEVRESGATKSRNETQEISCVVKSDRNASDFHPDIPLKAFVVACRQRSLLLGQATTHSWGSVYFEYFGMFLNVDPADMSERIADPESITRIKEIRLTQ